MQAVKPASAGSVIGLTGAFLLSHLMAKMLFGVQPTDPLTFVGVSVILGLAALLATVIPARKAIQIDPMIALRSE